jgi:DNA modification methylase
VMMLIITDPPYNVGFDFGGEYDDKRPPEEYDELLRATLRPPCVVLHRPEGICRLSRLFGMDPTAIVAWVYDGVYAKQWRAIGWFGLKPDLGGLGDWWNIQPLTGKRAEKTAHPCQTPQELMDQVIAVTPNLEFIVDPFMGSGTTLAVAKSRKLRALGIEQSARFCEIAVQRLREG